MLLVGERDGMVPPEDAERVRTLLPGTQIVFLQHAGHLAHEEEPDAVATRVVRFAQGPWKR